jgi:hypothetical protein
VLRRIQIQRAKVRARVVGVVLCALTILTISGCGSAGTDLNQLINDSTFPDSGDSDSAPASVSVEGGAEGAAAVPNGVGVAVIDPFADAGAFKAQTAAATHNAGLACINSGCHGTTTASAAGAPALLIGGTVYADYQGKTPAAGVEVRIMDSQGHVATAYSGPEGNFYLGATGSSGVAFPAVIGARNATATRPMITVLASSFGACGQANCHVPGGGPPSGAGNYYPIHVP